VAKIPKMPEEFVFVEWNDAHADFDQISPQDAHTKHHSEVVLTPGWVMKEDKEGITIAGEAFISDETYRAPSHIPGVLIRHVHRVTFRAKSAPKSLTGSDPNGVS
jgi:hypothetical protein